MARRREDDPIKRIASNPLVQIGGLVASLLVLGGTVAYANSSPERRRRFKEGGERAARQSAEARRYLAKEARLRELRQAYFTSGRGRDLLAERAKDLAPVGEPFADAVSFAPSMNMFSFGGGYASPSRGAQFAYAYDGHDGIGWWRLELAGAQVSGAIAKPDARLTIYCAEGSGLLEPEQRRVIRRLLGTPGSRIAEVEFVRADHHAIERAIWEEYLAANGCDD
jgi:hypothetical protein